MWAFLFITTHFAAGLIKYFFLITGGEQRVLPSPPLKDMSKGVDSNQCMPVVPSSPSILQDLWQPLDNLHWFLMHNCLIMLWLLILEQGYWHRRNSPKSLSFSMSQWWESLLEKFSVWIWICPSHHSAFVCVFQMHWLWISSGMGAFIPHFQADAPQWSG